MSVSMRFEGLEELRAALRDLPSDLAAEGSEIVLDLANEAKAELEQAYPDVTGDLRGGVKVKPRTANFKASVQIASTAPHAHLYEYGTQARHTEIGANRGAMPPRATFVPVLMRKRRAMYERLKGLLTRHGLEVSGDAG